MNNNVDWNKLGNNGHAPDMLFEQIWWHVVKTMFDGKGLFVDGYNMPGSEFYIKLTSDYNFEGVQLKVGDVIGWQCKYWQGQKDANSSPLDANHIKELEDGFGLTYSAQPNIKVWVICTPGQFKYEQKVKLEQKIRKKVQNFTMIYWERNYLEHLFMTDSKYRYIRNHYFCEGYDLLSVIIQKSKETLESLKKKFDVELHQASSVEERLLNIFNIDRISKIIEGSIAFYEKRRKRIYFPNYEETQKEEPLSEEQKEASEAWLALNGFVDGIINVLSDTSLSPYERLQKSYCKYLNSKDSINEQLKKLYGAYGKKEESALEGIQELLGLLNYNQIGTIGIITLLRNTCEQSLNVLGEAGTGKTHFCCSLADTLLGQGVPCVFLKGSSFRYDKPIKETILNLLDINGLAFEDFIEELDFVGKQYRVPIPIIIDGLNESKLSKDGRIWAEELPPLQSCIKGKDIRLITTCREKEEYLQRIYDADSVEKVANHVVLDGFDDGSLQTVINKYFNKYSITVRQRFNVLWFKNPLMLKVFCEVHKGTNMQAISLPDILRCLESYGDKIINRAACMKGCTNKRLKNYIINGLSELSMILYENNTREISLYDKFDDVFDEDTSNILIEEGLFSVDIDKDTEYVQFSIDKIAGLFIAKELLKGKSEKDVIKWLSTEETTGRLLDITSPSRHPLAEDICAIIFYLFPHIYGKEIFEVVKGEWIEYQSIRYIQLSATNKLSSNLKKFLATVEITELIAKQFLSLMIEKVKSRDVFQCSIFNPLFSRIPQLWINQYWHIPLLYHDIHYEMVSLLEKHGENTVSDIVTMSLWMCGTVFREYNHRYLSTAINAGMIDIEECLAVIEELSVSNDTCIHEYIFLILLGITVKTRNKEVSLRCADTVKSIMTKRNTNHAVIIDCVETIFSFCNDHFGTNYSMSNLLEISWEDAVDLEETKEYEYLDYDFVKNDIRTYCNNYRHQDQIYSENQLKSWIIRRMQNQGFNPTVYHEESKKRYDRLRYNFDLHGKFANKAARYATMEILGWLMRKGYISAEYGKTLRSSKINDDPTYIPILPKELIFLNSLLCSDNDYANWVNNNPLQAIHPFLRHHLLEEDGEMTLIYASISQETNKREQNVYISINPMINGNEYDSVLDSFCHRLAGEIGWRNFTCKEDEDNPLPLVTEYSFSNWCMERPTLPSFAYLSDLYAVELGLSYDAHTHSWIDKNGCMATRLYYCDRVQFLYVRNDILKAIKKAHNYSISLNFYAHKNYKDGNNHYMTFSEIIDNII